MCFVRFMISILVLNTKFDYRHADPLRRFNNALKSIHH
ncbi:hypothetical protein GLGR_2332 [Leminorella grimontii ATCC 33999 = DSM 5078]|nr:hypothetical protein GLGR_2332 [Leminorella grimontii ATCC 33999 = DSM 5078]